MRGDSLGVKTNAGYIVGLVEKQYNSSGAEIDTAAGVYTAVETVDLVFTGIDQSRRGGVVLAASEAAATFGEAFPFPTA